MKATGSPGAWAEAVPGFSSRGWGRASLRSVPRIVLISFCTLASRISSWIEALTVSKVTSFWGGLRLSQRITMKPPSGAVISGLTSPGCRAKAASSSCLFSMLCRPNSAISPPVAARALVCWCLATSANIFSSSRMRW